MGAKPSSEAQRSKSSQNGHKSTNTQLSRKFVDALVDSTSIDEMLEVVQRRMEHATPQTTSVALRHLTVRTSSDRTHFFPRHAFRFQLARYTHESTSVVAM